MSSLSPGAVSGINPAVMPSEPMDDVVMERLGFTSLSVNDEKVASFPTTPPRPVTQNSFGQPPLSPTMSLDSTTSETDNFSTIMAPARSLSMTSAMSAFSVKNINGIDTTTDEFRMYSFKVLPCTMDNCQDWNKCPYAHPDEKATRRDPRKYHYMPEFCQALRKNTCPNGDACLFSHSVFETWLHPAKYRTQMCKKLTGCERDVCFFAHTPAERRVPFCAQVEALEPSGDAQLTARSASKKRLKAVQAAMQKAASFAGELAPRPPPPVMPGTISRSTSADSHVLRGWTGLPPSYPPAPPPPPGPSTTQSNSQILETLYHAQKLLEMCSASNAPPLGASPATLEQLQTGQHSMGGGMDPAQLQMAHSLALQILQQQPQQVPLQASASPSSHHSNTYAPGPRSTEMSAAATSMASNSYSPFQSPSLFQNPSSFFTM